MVVLSQNYGGLVAYCDRCRALLGWKAEDVYGTIIYCPICKNQIEVPFNKNYNDSTQKNA